MDLSIVTTMYHSAPCLQEFYDRIRDQVEQITQSYEIVFVNDGSPDNALEVALQLYERDSRVRIIDLSRNFGHHKAMMSGLIHTTGDLVFLIDCDLEEPPEVLSRFHQSMLDNPHVDVVYGTQKGQRIGPWFWRFSGRLYYRILNFLTPEAIAEDQLTARLMTRRYVDALVQHKEHLFSIEGLWHITGYDQLPIVVPKTRVKGSSTYNFTRRMAYFIYSIAAFSNRPLIYIAILGMAMTLGSGLFVILLLAQHFLLGNIVEGWTSVVASLWLLSGIIILILGIIAIYLSIIFIEVKDRPYTIVRRIYEKST